MHFRSLSRFRPESLRNRVENSIRTGTAVRKGEWLLANDATTTEQIEGVGEAILAWCREQIGSTRRPYGIDQLALAIACAEPGGATIASVTFGVFRPMDFYRERGVGERVAAFTSETIDAAKGVQKVRFAAALFSWGDLARETIYCDEPAG